MDAELKTEWVAALRSGDYDQGQNSLRNDSGFCCLGVLCEVVARKHPDKVNIFHDPDAGFFQYNGAVSYLPLDIADIAGIEYNGEIPGGPTDEGAYGTVANMNDAGESFHKIADVIEERF